MLLKMIWLLRSASCCFCVFLILYWLLGVWWLCFWWLCCWWCRCDGYCSGYGRYCCWLFCWSFLRWRCVFLREYDIRVINASNNTNIDSDTIQHRKYIITTDEHAQIWDEYIFEASHLQIRSDALILMSNKSMQMHSLAYHGCSECWII